MNTVLRLIRVVASLGILAIFVLALLALFSSAQSTTQSQSPLPTATSPVSQLPTPTINTTPPKPYPTLPASPTPPPVPTLPPTPVVTPIPTAVPPIIPEVIGKTQQPFWIIYWQDNEVWRIDDQSKERQLLLDTYERLGLYLTANPYLESLINTKQQSRVKVSPDGQKLALVVVDKPGLVSKGEMFTFSIYLFNIKTGDLELLSEGASPEWSPNGKHIAFLKNLTPDGIASDGKLWIADLETSQIYALIEGAPTTPELRVSDWTWSPDSQRVAYRYSEGRIGKPEIWIKSVADSSPPYLVPNIPPDFYPYGLSWMPNGQYLLGNVQDWVAPEHPINLWAISVNTGDRQQLTRDLFASIGQWSSDGKWLAFSAIPLYEREEQPYDLWLLSASGTQLLRVTSALPQDLGGYWSPDGTRLVFRREGIGLAMSSLATGEVASLGVNLLDLSSYNYAIGGVK